MKINKKSKVRSNKYEVRYQLGYRICDFECGLLLLKGIKGECLREKAFPLSGFFSPVGPVA